MAWEPKKPLSIETVEVAPPKAHEVRLKVRSQRLRIDNGDFHVNSFVFTFSLIYLKLLDIFYTMIHQMKAEIIRYRIIPMP